MSLTNARLFLINIFFILSIGLTSHAQKWTGKHWGIQTGISIELGTTVNYVGLKIQGYYTNEFVQLNIGNHIRFNSSHLGNRKNFVTQRINTGIALLAGKRNARPQLIFDGLNHQTQYEYGLAYNYLWYFDNIGSSQRSGGFGLHYKQLSFLIENDIFAGSGRDRFRTSYASFHYHDDLYNLSLNTTLWTGETWGTRFMNTPDSTYQKGYKDLRETLYGKTSHGIISVGLDYQIFYGNHVSALAGIDSEQMRNIIQNKFMHDKKFIPKRWRKPNVNYPMLNLDGLPIHTNQEAKPSHLFLEFGLNRCLTY